VQLGCNKTHLDSFKPLNRGIRAVIFQLITSESEAFKARAYDLLAIQFAVKVPLGTHDWTCRATSI
jgi:hypothetical protein